MTDLISSNTGIVLVEDTLSEAKTPSPELPSSETIDITGVVRVSEESDGLKDGSWRDVQMVETVDVAGDTEVVDLTAVA